MRLLLLKVCALLLSLGVVVFVVQANRSSARAVDAPAAPQPSAPASASAAATVLHGNPYGIIGPATKADPHAMRRAVESLVPAPSSAQAPR